MVEPGQICWEAKANARLLDCLYFIPNTVALVINWWALKICWSLDFISVYWRIHNWMIVDTIIYWQLTRLHIWIIIHVFYQKTKRELKLFPRCSLLFARCSLLFYSLLDKKFWRIFFWVKINKRGLHINLYKQFKLRINWKLG